ncbi:hypothetical protein [Bradyrhizobium oligotrophicum]|uniref:hypothetical protein n=1 Tax=Bradyrhizobium oligotrophicum TaxID=44255 RepID=UPI003EB90473
MGSHKIMKAAERARGLLNTSEVESIGVSRDETGSFYVRVDVEPGADKARISSLLEGIGAPVKVRTVSGRLASH